MGTVPPARPPVDKLCAPPLTEKLCTPSAIPVQIRQFFFLSFRVAHIICAYTGWMFQPSFLLSVSVLPVFPSGGYSRILGVTLRPHRLCRNTECLEGSARILASCVEKPGCAAFS